MSRPLGDFGRLPAQFLRLVAQHRDLAAGVFGVQGDHLLRILRARQLLGELEGCGDVALGKAHREFARRKQVTFAGVKTWIATREDLILSKLVWAKDTESELQKRDVRSLLDPSVDREYVEQWAKRLGVDALFEQSRP